MFTARAGSLELSLVREGAERRLVAGADRPHADQLSPFEGERSERGGQVVLVGPSSPRNAAAARAALPWLRPVPIGLMTSAGFGDRLGLATPGHVRALRSVGGHIAPIFAQQSIREMTRTGRTPQQVIDDAMWGAFEAGWTSGYGADADHLKTAADISSCAAAGFTFFTIDPGEHVDDRADTATLDELRAAWDVLPWARLEDDAASLRARYAGASFDVEGTRIVFDERTVMKAAVKYGRAIAHVTELFRHTMSVMAGRAFEFEVSVDETDTPTTHAEHILIAAELRRLGVRWESLAPRFVGRFEKGVDYIGDLKAFHADVSVHAAIARQFGPYKISLHSGSDKFSIYEMAARETRGLVHLKTAGTSYLEALRAVALVSPDLFRSIYRFSIVRYQEDRASYHVSASIERAPGPDTVADGGLVALLDDFDVREILHVTFGSVLRTKRPDGALLFADALMALLAENPEAYASCLERHFVRHLQPFVTR
ncbi:MAG: tagaturonate epimerase family protein [Acidobacteria bacterium]|nr:tagaturonate epimerase family protein [Acidobacteriota bacterium]